MCLARAQLAPVTKLLMVQLHVIGGEAELSCWRVQDLHISMAYTYSDEDVRRLRALLNHRIHHITFCDIRNGCCYLDSRCRLFAALAPFYRLRRGLHVSF